MNLPSRLCALLASLAIVTAPAAAQGQYDILHAFPMPPGEARSPLLLASDNNLYGMTTTGGRANVGVIYVIKPQPDGSATWNTLHEFEPAEGRGSAYALVEGPEGDLYGTSPMGGPFPPGADRGTVFKVNRVTGQLTVLQDFTSVPEGTPGGSLVLGQDGNFYGTTYNTVFRMTPAGAIMALHTFVNGSGPGPDFVSLVATSDGHFYGAAANTLFRVALDGTFTTMQTFADSRTRASALLAGRDGNVYGGYSEPVSGLVNLFRMTPDGTLTVLHTMDSSTEGSATRGLYQTPDGTIYGTALSGPTQFGTAFKMTETGVFSLLHRFTSSQGSPWSSVVLHPNGFFYGTTDFGVGEHQGIVYSMTPAGQVVTRQFLTTIHGYHPSGAAIVGPDGALYGMTMRGGLLTVGTIYRYTPSSGLQPLHMFFGLDGAYPIGSLIVASDGLMYGVTQLGGFTGRGTIFRISTTGAFAVVHTFGMNEGASPGGGLVEARDGAFYGTTRRGGPADQGTVFRLTRAGAFTTLASFSFTEAPPAARNIGVYPGAPLVEGTDGSFYGTTYGIIREFSAINDGGTVFRMIPAGQLTTLQEFPAGRQFPQFYDGPRLLAPLFGGSDGHLYGSSCCGGRFDGAIYPELFRITITGTKTTLRPVTAHAAFFAEGSDGALYGVLGSTVQDKGQIFRMDAAGVFTTLKVLDGLGSEGIDPMGLRIVDGDTIIGTTHAGGPLYSGGGVLFRFRMK